MFNAYHFIYDGVPGEAYGLMLGYVGSSSKSDAESLGADLEIAEDRAPSRVKSIFYGVEEKPLEFELSFVACQPFDRFELEQIASSLAGKHQPCPLYICQPDMEDLHYRCILNNFKVDFVRGDPIGLTCTAHCDSPFAYMPPQQFAFSIDGSGTGVIVNESSYNGFLYPTVQIRLPAGSLGIAITNESDRGRVFELALKQALGTDVTFEIDENYVVTCDDTSIGTPYECIRDYRFFRLVKGRNDLKFSGKGSVTLTCEFLKRVGG